MTAADSSTFQRGETVTFPFVVTDNDGAVVDLSTGTLTADVYARAGDKLETIAVVSAGSIGAGSGIVIDDANPPTAGEGEEQTPHGSVQLAATLTAQLPEGRVSLIRYKHVDADTGAIVALSPLFFIEDIASGAVAFNVTLGPPVGFDHIHDDRYYTEAETDTAIQAAIDALIGGAPGALDTLNELAAALGDDAAFSTSVANALALVQAAIDSKADIDDNGFLTAPSINRITTVSPRQYGAFGDDLGELVTTPFQNMIDALRDAGGGVAEIPAGSAGYLLDRMVFSSSHEGIRIAATEPGTYFKNPPGGQGFFRLNDSIDIELDLRGLRYEGVDTGLSALIYLAGAVRPKVWGGDGSKCGAAKDVLYLGAGSVNPYCVSPRIGRGFYGHNAGNGRNIITVVAVRNAIIDDYVVEYAGTSLPSCGIDVEGNDYEEAVDVVIRNGISRYNPAYGIKFAFADQWLAEHNHVHDNLKGGIIGGIFGNQFDEDKARSNVDIRAISSIDTVTGRLTLSSCGSLRRGSSVQFFERGDGDKPTEFDSATRWMVVDNDGTSVLLATNPNSAVTSLASDSFGTLTTDPSTSALCLVVSDYGGASRGKIAHNTVENNGTTAGDKDIELSQSVDVDVVGNIVNSKADMAGIWAAWARGGSIKGNTVTGTKSSTSTSSQGIHIGTSADIEQGKNRVEGYVGGNFKISDILDCRLGALGEDEAVDGGTVSGANYSVQNAKDGKVGRAKVRQDPTLAITYGFKADTNIDGTEIDDIDCLGSGSSVANSVALGGTTTFGARIGRVRRKDGTWEDGRSASKYVFPTIADGASYTTTVTVTGARPGDKCRAWFSTDAGADVRAWCLASNTITVRADNNTGVQISGPNTLNVSVVKQATVGIPGFISDSENLHTINGGAGVESAFDNAYWSKIALKAFGSGSVANAAVAPNGNLEADLILSDTTTSQHYLQRSTQTGTSYLNENIENGFYVKNYNAAYAVIFCRNENGTQRRAWFNLATGEFETVEAGLTPIALPAPFDFWYIANQFDGGAADTSATLTNIQISNADNVTSWTGDGTGFYLWRAQFKAPA